MALVSRVSVESHMDFLLSPQLNFVDSQGQKNVQASSVSANDIQMLFCSENQLKKYGDLRTSRKSKLPLSGRGGKTNDGYDVSKLSSKFSRTGML